MTVLIKLTTVGADSGPTYNLYSSPDGTTFTQFATGITKAALLAGYPDTVPNGTTTIRVTSIGTLCTNSKDLTVGIATTTTTTTIINYQFNLTQGIIGCDGVITWTPIGPVTVYSNSPTLGIGVALYTLPDLKDLVSYSAVKSGSVIYELNLGIIDGTVNQGGGC